MAVPAHAMSPIDQEAARQHYQGREIRLYGQTDPSFDGLTSYKQDYPRHPLEPRPAGHGSQYIANPAKFDGTTTYGQNYIAHDSGPRATHYAPAYQPNSLPFDGSSTYGEHFKPHALERTHANRTPAQWQPSAAPFDGASSYKSDYLAHPLPERQHGSAVSYQPNQSPFDGTSTYKDNYVPHMFESRPAPTIHVQPREALPFDGSTTYGDQFKPYPINPRNSLQRAEYHPSDARFEGMSETMDKYRAWAIDPANRRGGGPPPMRPALPFDGVTTHREMFKGWQLPPRRPALGVQVVGDVAYVLIPANAPVPALGRQIFTTVHDNQPEISILILEGDFTQASRCNVLGQFDMRGLPPGPKGTPRIEVTMHVDQNGVLNVSALDLNTQRQEQWLRSGDMVAHV